MQTNIRGYDYALNTLETSPVSLDDLELLKKTLLWSKDDEKYIKMAGEILSEQIDKILDLWYGYVGSHQHLLYYFTDGKEVINEYLDAVRLRFGQWIKNLCFRTYDQSWLNYQYEIAKRHHKIKKNLTDNVQSVPFVNFRYLVAFIYPITSTIKGFLSNGGHSPQEIEAMYDAWFKAVVLSVVLLCYPYVKEGEF